MSAFLSFHIPAEPLSMNDSDGAAARRSKVARKQTWKEATYYAACAAVPGVGPSGRSQPPSDIYVSIPVAGNRRRDPHNWYPTIKVIVDALVLAEFWADDTPEYITTHEPDLRVVPPADLWKSPVYVRVVPRG